MFINKFNKRININFIFSANNNQERSCAMSMYTFKYEGSEIKKKEFRPQFINENEAREVKKLFEELGLNCGGIYSVEGDIPFITAVDDYIERHIRVFENYLKKELEVLKCEGIENYKEGHSIVDVYINELRGRIFRFIEVNGPYILKQGSIDCDKKDRMDYILRVASVLKLRSMEYVSIEILSSKSIRGTLEVLSTHIFNIQSCS
jgi:hypothetical protein